MIAFGVSNIKKNIENIQKIIEKSKCLITLIAVSKGQPVEKIQEAIDTGLHTFGENYVQEFLRKWEKFQNVNWVFIGHLQTNKVKYIIDKVSMIQTVDSLKLFETIHKEAQKISRKIPILIEVNIGKEKTKSGILPKNLKSFLNSLPSSPFVEIQGLMCIPPYQKNPEDVRPYFKKMTKLLKECNLRELSMGMSHDFHIAIEEGTTQIRVGEALFGPRKPV